MLAPWEVIYMQLVAYQMAENNVIMDEPQDQNRVEKMCKRLAGIPEVKLPTVPEPENKDEKQPELTYEQKFEQLKQCLLKSPLKFVQSCYPFISPSEIVCFNDVSNSEEISYYIQKICQRKNLECRQRLDGRYLSAEVKNRRFRAMEDMKKNTDYFSESEMQKRNPQLYEQYVGRFLTAEEKEKKEMERIYNKPPPTLVTFFMDVMMKREEREEAGASQEEFDSDSDDEESDIPKLSEEEKRHMYEEFQSRMYDSFLEGHDKKFEYRTVDENADYDDLEQITRDKEEEYFEEEEPSSSTVDNTNEDSEDELDRYMRSLKENEMEIAPTDSVT